MREFVLSLLAATAFAGAAQAGDLPSSKAPPAPPVIANYNWTGFYGGVQLGGAFGQTDFSLPASTYRKSFGDSGVFGGVHGGYNYQIQQIVVGAEAEFNALGDKGSFGDFTTFATPYSVNAHHDWIGSIDGRLGYAVKNYLIYAVGGYAFANANSAVLNNSVQVAGLSTSLNGYDVGGGVEYAFTRNWSGKFEYRYYQFDAITRPYTSAATLYAEKPYASTFRLGLAYHWGKEEPATVAAKY